MFDQAHYADNNAPGAVDSYVSTDLAALGGFPEKDAYLMARAFRIWSDVFGAESDRVVRVATAQHSWVGNTGRVLTYLFDTDGIGCDALSVGGYFSFSRENHEEWLEEGENLTMETIYRDTYDNFLETSYQWTKGSAAYANLYGIDYLVYEGGQHMQPQDQEEWNYNQRLYDFQIHSRMYDLYHHNFSVHDEGDVDCDLFMAFSFLGTRESKYGSWGHLESMEQIGTSYSDAPKFRALLDVNE